MNDQLKELAKELAERHVEFSQEEMLEILSKPFTPNPKAKINLEEWRKKYEEQKLKELATEAKRWECW
jgi:hypothetical protein